MADERTALLQFQLPGSAPGQRESPEDLRSSYHQFCHLVGVVPVDLPPGQPSKPNPESLYARATRHRRNQAGIYMFSATLTNSLLLSQIILGATLTALGASDSSRILIATFGALNTVIAGLIAFLKSRGQPMRARMFRDDLDRVVDEIENSAVMWLGISKGHHGYDAIDTEDSVTVRSEVARLTRLYDRAVKTNTLNDPDIYSGGSPSDAYSAATRARLGAAGAGTGAAAAAPAPGASAIPPPAPPLVPGPSVDPIDESPATKAPEPAKPVDADTSRSKPDDTSGGKTNTKDATTDETSAATPAPAADPKPEAPTPPAAVAATDPDASPASAAVPPKAKADAAKTSPDADDGKKHSPEDDVGNKTGGSSTSKDA
ncbi:mitochondrial FAD carrier protein FLX1-like [Teratosphaeria destructans]|uniref:Mitochondrial FAD carrier protein FLX1-like n=1 Tax=Teratosphaeria destructans TaxID=418781 RepID=A0A9W7W2W6_9PEZI|nr:mitochondrial FAD carrier protein FLX1-like [Teratosphaeria destructans]